MKLYYAFHSDLTSFQSCLSDYMRVLTICFLHLLLQVDQNLHRFDASRSTGHLCAATANNFEQVISTVCAVSDITIYLFVVKLWSSSIFAE